MKILFFVLAAAVALSSCATMPRESPILELDNIALDGDQWIKVQNIDKNTGKPIANAECAVYLLKEDGIGRHRQNRHKDRQARLGLYTECA